MKKDGWQSKPVRCLTTLMTLAMMTLIFFFSTEPAEQSDATSGHISRAVICIAYPDYDQKSPAEQERVFENTQHIVRKTAHFLEYLVLGILIRICLISWFGFGRPLIPVSWAAGTLYAVTDEFHQMLTDGRSGQWMDVLLDSGGVLTGVIISSIAFYLRYRHRRSV